MIKSRHILPILLTLMVLAGCNGTEKLVKSTDFDAKYEAAMKFYNGGSYTKAIQLFENLAMHYRGKDYSENISWYYGQSLLKEKDYYTAAYQFKSFVRQFPYSEHAEEALFLSAYCKYCDSPAYTLDQSLTKEAITEFEQFTDKYPQSTHIPEVNKYLDEMRDKLMRKDYDIAYGYYKIESYHAAYVALQNFLNYYPDTEKREDAMYYMLKSGYEYAINSKEEKMKERLQQVVNDFDKFSASFTNSKYMANAQTIYTKSKNALAKLEAQQEKEKKELEKHEEAKLKKTQKQEGKH